MVFYLLKYSNNIEDSYFLRGQTGKFNCSSGL